MNLLIENIEIFANMRLGKCVSDTMRNNVETDGDIHEGKGNVPVKLCRGNDRGKSATARFPEFRGLGHIHTYIRRGRDDMGDISV